MKWETTTKRFVVFFDILGFKEMVSRSNHKEVLEKLQKLKNAARLLENFKLKAERSEKLNLKIAEDQTKSVTFSDSIIFFSKGGAVEDFVKIAVDSWWIVKTATQHGIAIKGAMSFGEVTVDFDNSLFFGQPIIDAYLLHEDLHVLGVVLDHNAENQWRTLIENKTAKEIVRFGKVKMKFGASSHSMIVPKKNEAVEEFIEKLEQLYTIASGRPRVYMDNSIEYYKSLVEIKETVTEIEKVD